MSGRLKNTNPLLLVENSMRADKIDRQQLRVDLLEKLRLDHPTLCRRWFEDIRVLGIVNGTILIQIVEPVQLKYLQIL